MDGRAQLVACSHSIQAVAINARQCEQAQAVKLSICMGSKTSPVQFR